MTPAVAIGLAVLGVAVGAALGYLLARLWAAQRRTASGTSAEGLLTEARLDAKRILAAAEEEGRAKAEAYREREEAALAHRKLELANLENRLTQREETLEQRASNLAHREEMIIDREEELKEARAEVERLREDARFRLEQVAGIDVMSAKAELLEQVEDEARREAMILVRDLEVKAREEADRRARRILATAIQRLAAEVVTESTVAVIELPSDEMKGRIIGREGRNIRHLESVTGTNLIVDDTPEAVIVSGFDPFRREIARTALERLVADGRIHPARIEEMVEKVKAEFDQKIRQEGEAALLELNLPNVHVELVKLLGRLRYRTSYGQNVLQHSKEVSFLAGTMAAELKANVQVAKRAGLLHDIGKAVDREMDGTHLEIGIDLLRKYGERENVVHAMACHHGDYDPETVEAVLVTAADALSAARPGARREILETYVKRLEALEELASSFKGVQKSYAIQAGREVRVIVDSKKLGDDEAIWLSRDIANKVESELTYPGQIKVTVIRETRSIEYAK